MKHIPFRLAVLTLATGFAASCPRASFAAEAGAPANTPPPAAKKAARPPNPTRSPTDLGAPKFTVVGAKPGATELRGAPGLNPPADAEGDFLIGPDYVRAPEMNAVEGVPKGRVEKFTLRSEDSKFYPGISRMPPGATNDARPANLAEMKSYPKPYTRSVTVYIPAQYRPGTAAPLIVTADGPDANLPVVLDNLIAQKRVPAMIAVMIQNGGSDAQGSERGLEYDTVSGRYAEFVEAEVLPAVEKNFNVQLTRDPAGRATMGGSSGAAAAFTMAWFHPEWYRRVISYSGTFVNQQWPVDSALPHGAWSYHESIIPQSPAKPLRVWLQVGDRDNFTRNDGYHDWVLANHRMAAALKAKGYHYQYVFCRNCGHTDRAVKAQTLPEALEWAWQGFPR